MNNLAVQYYLLVIDLKQHPATLIKQYYTALLIPYSIRHHDDNREVLALKLTLIDRSAI
ncbi:hypothetical protein ARAF_2420 [Arsenophonus endosymbiont of Aleurodicus floccissimus]|nr:hypothetical protein ARAF_2420 [Arsenophonus endosymbiont of Aleurodicus floccissimus]